MIFVPLLLGLPLGLPLAEPLEPFEPFQSTRSRAKVEVKALSWTFLEVHAQRRSVNGIQDDLTGFGARVSFDLQDGFFLRGGADYFSNDADLIRYDLGAGHHVEIQTDTEVYALASWVHAEIDGAGAADSDDDGWRAEVGMRSLLDKVLEGEARVGYEDVNDEGLIYGVDVRWWWQPNLALGLGYEREVEDDVYTISLRYAF